MHWYYVAAVLGLWFAVMAVWAVSRMRRAERWIDRAVDLNEEPPRRG